VFRQYSCFIQYKFLYANHSNVEVVPLGFNSQLFLNIPEPSVSYALHSVNNTRSKVWSFIGTPKGKRAKDLQIFNDLVPYVSEKAHPEEVLEIYSNSHFVASPRGWVNLDCLRHSEAMVAGAIPVVVGAADELNATFGHYIGTGGSKPPWLFAASWPDAKLAMRSLIADTARLRRWHQRVAQWWSVRIHLIRRRASQAQTTKSKSQT
jgi:hypothetical protein